MKCVLAVGVLFWCSMFVIQESPSSKVKNENQAGARRIGVHCSPTECNVRTTFLTNELPSKGLAFYESGDRFLSVFIQVELPDDGNAYYVKRGSVNIKGQKEEKATAFQVEKIISANVLRVRIPIENIHAKLIIDRMKNEVVGLGRASGNAIPETGNRTPEVRKGKEVPKLSVALELDSVKKN